jgi:Ner family transcriptional regulator
MAKAKGWHPEEIKAALRKRLGPITHLAQAWGMHPSTISAVLANPARSAPVELRIAQALGQHPHTLWPDRWTPDGVSLPRGRNNSPAKAGAQRQIEEAA